MENQDDNYLCADYVLKLSITGEVKKRNAELKETSQSIGDTVPIHKNLEVPPTNEIDEKEVNELEETERSIKFEDKANDKREYTNYEEKKNTYETKELDPCLLDQFKNKEDLKSDETLSSETINENSFKCPFCKSSLLFVGEGFTLTLEKCSHTLCSWCVTKILEDILKNDTAGPRCPYIDREPCNSLIEEYEIRQVVQPELYEAYLEKFVIKMKEDAKEKIFHCKTSTCNAWYILENNNTKIFLCSLCKNMNFVDTEINIKIEELTADSEEYVKKERYNEMLLLSQSGITPNFESFECPICFVRYEPQEGLILQSCLHTFCKECIANVVLHSEDVDIKCPYKNDDYSCDEPILQSEIRAVVKPDDFENYLRKSIVQVERKAGNSSIHCKTPNCPNWVFVEFDVDHFLCPTCEENTCLLCNKIHTGQKRCDTNIHSNSDAVSKYSEDMIEIMLEEGSALRCPICKGVIIKIDGCDAITCTYCKTPICWITRGPRWGPGGVGDKSGGCKCEKYAKCHPLCRGCH